jgi:hypothetical protein
MKILICLVTTALLLEIYNVEILVNHGKTFAIGCAKTEVFLFPSVAMSIDSGCVSVVGRFGMCVGCRSLACSLCVFSWRVSVYCWCLVEHR